MTAKGSSYLLLGPETGEKENFIKSLINGIEKKKKSKPDVYKYFATETPCLEIISLLKNRLLFADYKVVIVFGAESIGKNDGVLLEEYLRHPAPDTMLILCTDEMRVAHQTVEQAIAPENKKIFWELLEHQKRGWVSNFFIKRSMRVDEEALDFIIEMVENNTKDLASICERLEIFFGRNASLHYEDIENFIYHSKEENVFTLFSGIVKRDFALSLEILDKILLSHEEDAIRILSGLLWQVHNVIQFVALLAQGTTTERAFQKLAIKTKRQQKLYGEAKANFSLEELLKIVALISQFDTWFRVHNQNIHRILLELFIYSITKKARL
jgi:DNA polymerase-3 subunit delta